MFDETAVANEDFSVDLPMIISKIALVGEVIRLYGSDQVKLTEVVTELEGIHLSGVCAILLEIERDLAEMNMALYGETNLSIHRGIDCLRRMMLAALARKRGNEGAERQVSND